MILKSIEMENFRQYYGKNTIEFASGDKNVTILFGGNGEGKTGIFRALMFGLFGDLKIDQDDKNSDLHLVNLKAVNDDEGKVIEAVVKVVFEHNGYKYSIIRSRRGVSTNGTYREQEGENELIYIDLEGNVIPKPIKDLDEINYEISKIVHDEMKNFFFFDGEQIDTLTTTRKTIRDSVRSTIRRVTQVDDLSRAEIILKQMEKNLDSQIKAKSTSHHLKRALDEKNQKESNLDSNNQKINQLQDEKIQMEENLKNLENKMKENSEAKEISARIELFEEKLLNSNDKYNRNNDLALKNAISITPLALLENYKDQVHFYLKGEYQKQQNTIPLPILEKSKLEKRCACCGLSLEEHLDSMKKIEDQISSYEHNLMTEFISNLSYHYDKKFTEQVEDELKKYLQEEFDLQEEIKKHEKDLQIQKDKLTSYSLNINELENILKNQEITNKDYRDVEVRLLYLQEQNAELEKNIFDLNRQIEKSMQEQDGLKILKNSKNEVIKALEAISPSLKSYEKNMQEQLTEKTTSIFSKLIDKQDRELISKIEINDRYEINILDRSNRNFSQDISQGQRKVAAISFIMALASIASESTGVITYPFFMDTPFANFDLDHRLSLIKLLPELISQWILLLTDTEMSVYEEAAFKNTNKIGAWYRIKKVEDYYSKIIKVDLKDDMLREGM